MPTPTYFLVSRLKAGTRVVYHFNVRNLWPISLEREHKGRDHVPTKFAKLALGGIEELLIYVEGEYEGP